MKHNGHTLPYREDGLAHCTTCGGAEGSLPFDCPGVKMTSEQEAAVYAGTLDYHGRKWWRAVDALPVAVRVPDKYVTGVDWGKANEEVRGVLKEGRRLEAKLVEVLTRGALTLTPVPMVLHCPACGLQHIDKPSPCSLGVGCNETGHCYADSVDGAMCGRAWDNPPHRSHQCQGDGCGFEWRPADVPTVGVEAVTTRGKNDGPLLRECQVAQSNGSCNCTGKCARGLSL